MGFLKSAKQKLKRGSSKVLRKTVYKTRHTVISKPGAKEGRIPPSEVSGIITTLKVATKGSLGASWRYHEGFSFDPGARTIWVSSTKVSPQKLAQEIRKILRGKYGNKYRVKLV